MVTITLPPELEQAVTEQARQKGTTPELLAIDGLREKFLPAPVSASDDTPGTMADFLGDFIGCFDSREIVPGGENLSEDTGRRFKELMLQKYRAGKL